MIAERTIGGQVYVCPKLPAEQALDLFIAVSEALQPVAGLLGSIALSKGDPALAVEFLESLRDLDHGAALALVTQLAAVPVLRVSDAPADGLAMEDLADLAVFAIQAQFGSFFARPLPTGLPPQRRDPDSVTLTAGESKALGPNISLKAYLLRPTAFYTSEPLCTLTELRTTLTLDDLADMHEALDTREYFAAKIAASRPKGGPNGRH